jgi:hypothetical protein
MHIRISRLLMAGLALSALAGCASTPPAATSPEAQVAERAQQRWEHLIAGNHAAAYALLSPGYRATLTFDDYRLAMLSSAVRWKGVRVSEVECSGADRCEASVHVDFGARGLPGVKELDATHRMSEVWLRLQGAWYHVPAR